MKQDRRPALAIAGGALLALLAGVLWLRVETGSRPVPDDGDVRAAVAGEAAVPRQVVQPATVRPASATGRNADDAAWCRLADFELAPSASSTLSYAQMEAARAASPKMQQMAAARRHLLQAWAAELAGRGDERSVAQGLLLAPQDPAARERLLELARRSSDPAVYAWGLRACGWENVCAGLSLRQWARLDPGNLRPWLRDASRGGPGLPEALHQISQASHASREGDLFLQTVVSLGRATAPGLRQAVEVDVPAQLLAALDFPRCDR